MAGEKEKEPERMDAPNQQAVGQPPPWEEGTGGSHKDTKAKAKSDPEEEEAKPKRSTRKDSEKS